MASKITNDPRIDPRLKAIFGTIPDQVQAGDVASREQLLAEEQTDNTKARIAMLEACLRCATTNRSRHPRA